MDQIRIVECLGNKVVSVKVIDTPDWYRDINQMYQNIHAAEIIPGNTPKVLHCETVKTVLSKLKGKQYIILLSVHCFDGRLYGEEYYHRFHERYSNSLRGVQLRNNGQLPLYRLMRNHENMILHRDGVNIGDAIITEPTPEPAPQPTPQQLEYVDQTESNARMFWHILDNL